MVNNLVVGLVIAGIDMEQSVELFIEKTRFGETGYMVLIDSKMHVMLHPDRDFILNNKREKSVEHITSRVVSGDKNFISTYNSSAKRYISSSLNIPEKYMQNIWYTVAAQNISEVMKGPSKFLSMMIIGGILFLIVCIVTFLITTKMLIEKPIDVLIKMTKDLSEGEGDLSKRIKVYKKDKIAVLSIYINKFVESINSLVSMVKRNVNVVTTGNDQLSNTMGEIVDSTQIQSKQLSEVASSIKEISSTSLEVSKNTLSAREKAEVTRDQTSNGQKLLSNVLDSIKHISNNASILSKTITKLASSSENIVKILHSINDIADKINLLALNAAIEAARAGEAGRGFPVVADEVRKLAERTQNATSEISDIINSFREESSSATNNMLLAKQSVDNGVKTVEETGKVFMDIVNSVDGIYDSNNVIESSVKEQSITIGNINDNVQGISSSIEEGSRSISDISDIVQELQKQSRDLKKMVDYFITE